MNKHFENGYGQKVLWLIVVVFIIVLFTCIALRVIYYRNDAQVFYIDGLIGFSAWFIWDLGKSIARSKNYKMGEVPPIFKKEKKDDNTKPNLS